MTIQIRLASLDDIEEIVGIHCSSIDKWFKYVDGEKIEAKYEELSIAERWAHGGPWMSIETCAVHVNYILTWGHYPLVAVLDNRVVGELELYIGYESDPLYHHGFIDVLEVHKEFRRRGIGRRLVKKAIEISREKNCNSIAVWPDPNAVEFYKKCGINKIAFHVKYIKLDLSNIRSLNPESLSIKRFPVSYDELKNWVFVSPRILSSFVTWIKSRWRYAVEENIVVRFEALLPQYDTAFIIKSMWMNRSEANLYWWIKDLDSFPQTMEIILGIAKYLGFNAIRLSVNEKIYNKYITKHKHEILNEYLVLFKELK